MTKPSRKLQAARAQLTHKGAAAIETKHRIRAIVDDVIAEADRRRRTGRYDYVGALCDELEKGGLSAWRERAALLPKTEVESGGAATSVHIGSLFSVIAAQVGARDQQAPQQTTDKFLDAIPVPTTTPVQEVEVIGESQTAEGNGTTEW
jgi:hypothetical protein